MNELHVQLDVAIREREEWVERYVRQSLTLNRLQDELTRLRKAIPADVLREYDRRHHDLDGETD